MVTVGLLQENSTAQIVVEGNGHAAALCFMQGDACILSCCCKAIFLYKGLGHESEPHIQCYVQ